MLDGEHDALTLAAEVEGTVGPGVEVASAAQALAGVGTAVLADVMDDDHGHVRARVLACSRCISRR